MRIIATKKCTKCKQFKSKGQFNKNVLSKDGLNTWCKSCKKAYDRKHYQDNIQQIKVRCSKYYEQNTLQINAHSKAYYYANTSQMNAFNKAYNKKHYHRIAWLNMKSRCYNKKNRSYKDYGGRGIKVCDRWLNSFETFKEDVGKRPTPKHSIDRMDNNGDYGPNNVKWSTMKEQANNRRKKK